MISRVACRVQPVFRSLAPTAIALLAALLSAAPAQAESSYLAYVTMQNGVAVIDTVTEELLGTAQVCSAGTPAAVGVAVLGSRLYVTCLNEGVVKVVDRKRVTNGSTFSVAAIIQLPTGSLHSRSSAVISQDGSQLYIATRQGVAVVDTATNTIVKNLALGPVSALDIGPNQTYVQLQDGQVVPLSQAQPQTGDPYIDGPDQPIIHDNIGSAWLSGGLIIGDTDFGIAPIDNPYLTPVRVGPAGPQNELPIDAGLTALAIANLGYSGGRSVYLAYGTDVQMAAPTGWQWRYNIGLEDGVQSTGHQDPAASPSPTLVSAGGPVVSLGILPSSSIRMYTVLNDKATVEIHSPSTGGGSEGFVPRIAIAGARTVSIPDPTVRVTIDSSPSGQSFSLTGAGCPEGNYVTPRTQAWFRPLPAPSPSTRRQARAPAWCWQMAVLLPRSRLVTLTSTIRLC